jgi:tetratricopeptide (TPR) repeat protein
MSRLGSFGHLFAAFVFLASSTLSYAAERDATCSQDSVETDPASVIAPCTNLLAQPGLSDAQRGGALFVRGQGHHRSKNLDHAAEDYDAALRLTPNNDAIYPERADVAFREGDLDQGMAFLRQALALNPKNARALRMVANYLSDQGRLDDAIRYASMALDADPNEAHALLVRSETYKRKHQFDLALRDADALAAMPPDRINRQGYLDMYGVKRDFHIMALQNRADIYAEIGNDELAERDLNAAVEYKRSGESLAARGDYLMDRPGQERAALQDLEEATTLDAGLVRAFYLKGLLLVQLQRYGNAFDAFDRAVEIDPQYDFALRMRALMYRELGQTDLAVRDLEHAMAMSPRVVSMTMRTLRQAGYWNTSEIPNGLTPQLQDAIRACMIDKHCN